MDITGGLLDQILDEMGSAGIPTSPGPTVDYEWVQAEEVREEVARLELRGVTVVSRGRRGTPSSARRRPPNGARHEGVRRVQERDRVPAGPPPRVWRPGGHRIEL